MWSISFALQNRFQVSCVTISASMVLSPNFCRFSCSVRILGFLTSLNPEILQSGIGGELFWVRPTNIRKILGRTIHGPMPVLGGTFGEFLRAIGPYKFPCKTRQKGHLSIRISLQTRQKGHLSIQISPQIHMGQWLPKLSQVQVYTGIGP